LKHSKDEEVVSIGYKIKSVRFYKDGTVELTTDPEAVPATITPCTSVEEKVLTLLSEGRKREALKLGYKLAVACIKSRCREGRDCNTCFLKDVCALPKNPEWFIKKGLLALKSTFLLWCKMEKWSNGNISKDEKKWNEGSVVKKKENSKSIRISVETWRKLMNLKIEGNLRSLDDVIQKLIKVYEAHKSAG